MEGTPTPSIKTVIAQAITGAFYARKFAGCDLNCWDKLPFTSKAELLADQEAFPPYGSNRTLPIENYVRIHSTSGTTGGMPLVQLDDAESWSRLLGSWEKNFQLMGLGQAARAFFPFSFGPFLGFWTAYEAASRYGMLVVPGGAMSTAARRKVIHDFGIETLFCTPTYALRLGESGMKNSSVRTIVVAGEPGGSLPGTRERIMELWNARVFDHYGLTEVGPVACECLEQPGGMHILDDYYAEVIDAEGNPLPAGNEGELVLTNLHRLGMPVIRYKTGDRVIFDPTPCPCGRKLPRLRGGVLGRIDDMLHIRGNNIHPTAIESIIRRFPEIQEFRLVVDTRQALPELTLELEGEPAAASQVERAIRDELHLRARTVSLPPGTLPRSEMKSRRIHHV